jgi:acylphosphatase
VSGGDRAESVVRRRLLVAGRVQGVGYRISCAMRAEQAGVAGFVRNLDDGRVEVVIEGAPSAVAEIEAWCRSGPRLALVTKVEAADEPPRGEEAFSVK